VLQAWWKVRRLSGYRAAWACFRDDLARDRTASRLRRFGQAMVLAAEMPAGIERIHAHFLHTPSSVARYAALMRGLPWSASAHAKDIWTSDPQELRRKLAGIDWLVTCTRLGFERLKQLAPVRTKLRLAYHGLDLAHLPAPAPAARDGDTVVILSVGRRVAKKGFDDLLEALARLPKDLNWRFEHIGGGALGDALKEQAQRLGIARRCTWHGAQSQEAVFAAYRRADIFALASKTAADGDQDGLPNVLLEAGHQRLAIVATRAAAIGEYIDDGDNGLLVEPGAPDQLAAALERLARDPGLRARLGVRAAETVRTRFAFDAGVDWIARALGHAPVVSEARAAE
jgi:glycosyltransferase involved in cell wall biosynthesis